MIVMRRDLGMRKGKIAAQAGHACVEVILRALVKENRLSDFSFGKDGELLLSHSDRPETPLSEWFTYGEAKICVYVNSEEELLAIDRRAREAGLLSALICDAGMTEFHGLPTYTCLAIEPATAERVDPITGSLPLY